MTRTRNGGLDSWIDGTRPATNVYQHTREGTLLTSYSTISGRGHGYAKAIDATRTDRSVTVALALPNGAEFIAALTGAIRAGADVYCLSSQDRAESKRSDSIRARLKCLPPDVIITSDSAAAEELSATLDGPLPAKVILAEELTAAGFSINRPQQFRLLQFTSGSTADIKAVRISAGAFARTIETIEDRLQIEDDDIAATWLPITHDLGLVGLVCQAAAGMHDLHVFQPTDFIRSPWSFMRAVSEHRVTITALPPFALGLLLARIGSAPADLDLTGLRAILIGGERVNADLLEAFQDTMKGFGLRIGALLPSYGAAEATVAVSIPHAGKPLVSTTTKQGATLLSCGPPMSGTDVRVVNEAGETCPDGIVGEIVVKASTVADGYLSSDPETAAIRLTPLGNPYRTGDSGLIRDGEIFPIGRLGDAIKVRGSFLHAEDVEQAVSSDVMAPVTVVLGDDGNGQSCLVLCKESAADRVVESVVRVLGGFDTTIDVVRVAARHMARTTSGKPRRSQIWRSWQAEASAQAQQLVSQRGHSRG